MTAAKPKPDGFDVSVAQADLAAALGLVGSIVTGTRIPVLSRLKLRAFTGEITITATDLDAAIMLAVPARVEAFGETLVDAKKLAALVALLPPGSISLSGTDGSLRLAAGPSRFTLSAEPVEHFPAVPDSARAEAIGTVRAGALAAGIAAVASAMVKEGDSRFSFQGAYLERDGVRLKLYSVDGHRATLASLPAEFTGDDALGFLLPRSGVAALRKLAASLPADAPVTLRADPAGNRRAAHFSAEGVSLAACLMDAVFPRASVAGFFAAPFPAEAVFDRAALAVAAKRLAVLVQGRESAVSVEIADGALRLAGDKSEYGEGVEALDAVDAPPLLVKINAHYFADAVSVVGGERVRVRYESGTHKNGVHLLFDSADAAEDVHIQHVVVGMRMS